MEFYSRKSARKFCSAACYHAWQKIHPNDGTRRPGDRPTALPVGTVTIRTRWKRNGDKRAWVKVAEPNVWRPRAVVVWEAAHGPVPNGMVVHHKNRNTLDDSLTNLELESRSAHLVEHRPEFEEKRAAAASAARWPAA